MRILVTGSAGHLGEGLMRTLAHSDHEALGLDRKASPFTDRIGSITDTAFVRDCMAGIDAVIHSATLHKPHVGTHSRQAFIDTNVSGTLTLLEAAANSGCRAFVFTSTTSTFGDAMLPGPGEPAVWVDEKLQPKPKNIYGVTKTAAEDLCRLFQRNAGLPCVVLRTSRFFPEADDDAGQREAFDDANLKVNELLYRRADIADVVSAHLLAVEQAERIGFARLIVTATTPFERNDAAELGRDAPAVLARRVPAYAAAYEQLSWRMLPRIGRVYDNTLARTTLGWQPRYDFAAVLTRLQQGKDHRSDLALAIGQKMYHDAAFEDGPYPTTGFLDQVES